MLLINYTTDLKPASIGVTTITGEKVMVKPGEQVEVSDVDAVTMLQSYSHIFKRVEVQMGNKEYETIIAGLKAEIEELQKIVKSNAKKSNEETTPVEEVKEEKKSKKK